MATEDLQWEQTIVASANALPASESARRAAWEDGYREEQRRQSLLPESFRHKVGCCSRRLAKVPHETRRWLKSTNLEKPEGRPLALEQEADTVQKYQAVWERYLCYCIQAHRLGRAEAQQGRGIRFTDEQ
ncbi:hypothetical protein LX36DRAFT_714916 [Colletotrichum falcatum]|nr:hypothetical protein LX36DRAFT_714916 [Colletotrichum falcatum]